MKWLQKIRSGRQEARNTQVSESAKEMVRRAHALTRTQLQLLLDEGVLSDDLFRMLIEAHSHTVGAEPHRHLRIETRAESTGESRSYSEAVEAVLTGLSSLYSPWSKIRLELSSIPLERLDEDVPDDLALDLVLATYIVRSFSLNNIVDDLVRSKLSYESAQLIDQRLGQASVVRYLELIESWSAAIECLEIPQFALAREIVFTSRSRMGLQNPRRENPIAELVIADMIVSKGIGVWHRYLNAYALTGER